MIHEITFSITGRHERGERNLFGLGALSRRGSSRVLVAALLSSRAVLSVLLAPVEVPRRERTYTMPLAELVVSQEKHVGDQIFVVEGDL